MTNDTCSAFFLVGPTAVGKSAVAQWIAENGDYDILSADSMLVYDGMDIGTAKPSRDERSSVRYYGIDIISPDRSFSAGEYCRYAHEVIQESSRDIIVVGGTGLYVKSLTDGFWAKPGALPERREQWLAILEEKGVEALQDELREKDPEVFESLDDKKNARRLIRALELVEQGEQLSGQSWQKKDNSEGIPLAGLMMSADLLNSRIVSRVNAMYDLGFADEVRGLLKKYPELSSTARKAIGYEEVIALLDGRRGMEEVIEKTVLRTRQLVKRQKTWFRHQANIRWIDVAENMPVSEVAKLVLNHWEQYGPVRIMVDG